MRKVKALNSSYEAFEVNCYAEFSRGIDGVVFNFAVAKNIYEPRLCVLHVESGKRVGLLNVWTSRGELPPTDELIQKADDVIAEQVKLYGADRVRVIIESAEVLK